MLKGKAIYYIAGVSVIALISIPTGLLAYNQYKLQQTIAQLMVQQKPQTPQTIEPQAGFEPVSQTSIEPAATPEPQQISQAPLPPKPAKFVQKSLGREYAMRPPAPAFDSEVPKPQQEAIHKNIARPEPAIPVYRPASQAKAPYLNTYVPQPQYKLQPWQIEKLKELHAPIPPDATKPMEAKVEEAKAEEKILGGDVTGSFALTSNYSFRGINQSKKRPAAQGGLEYMHKSGIYAGVWGSNVDFNDGDHAQLEADLYTGYRSTLTDNISSDIGAIYYAYPGSNSKYNYNYAEVYVSGQYEMPLVMDLGGGFKTDKVKISPSFSYSPQFQLKSGSAYYFKTTAAVPVGHGVTLDGHLGKQWISKNSAFGLPDYMDWSFGVAYALPKDFELKLQYIDTDIDNKDCPLDACDAKGVLSLSKSF